MENNYVSEEIFKANIKRLEERDEFEREANDIRVEQIKAIVSEAVISMKADNERLRNEIEKKNIELRNEMKIINARVEGKIDTLSARIEALQHRRYWDIAWFAIAVTAVVAILQYFSK